VPRSAVRTITRKSYAGATLAGQSRERPAWSRLQVCLDNAKVRALGWELEHDVAAGIRQTVRWYQENEWWWRPLKSGEFWEFYKKNYKPAPATA
jgi:dTDP-glucose 4,6-dehydratase